MKDLVEQVLSDKDAKQGIHINVIASKIKEMLSGQMMLDEIDSLPSLEEITRKISAILSREVKKKDSIFMKIKQKNGSYKKGVYKLRVKRNTNPLPIAPQEGNPEIIDTPTLSDKHANLFFGKAGECAVMSELLFRNYNVNTMMVDDGVDIVASKNNVFYFIQVKTATLKDNKIYSLIRMSRFTAFAGIQIRYIVVARCNIAGIDSNMYFLFSNEKIQEYIYKGVLKSSNDNINIKIRIDLDTRKPFLYNDTKEEDISFFMNRFEL